MELSRSPRKTDMAYLSNTASITVSYLPSKEHLTVIHKKLGQYPSIWQKTHSLQSLSDNFRFYNGCGKKISLYMNINEQQYDKYSH